ncbi:protein CHROMATIN REMODELING 35 [Iris pallida]|uniref:Protein CHROMATIN REMODELING 35 n=1 Tax=Iris pallida TaxID=29817 RepID=A0AAX6HK32_IRIPA|nr:protein CHROMATIN REMODELING 35 [Iris pallida]
MELYLNEAMSLARNKRMKLDNDDTAYSYLSNNAMLSDHRNLEERTPTKVIDYSDVYTLSNVLQEDGKYGSVSKDYEALHAQTMQVRNILSAIRPFAGSNTADQQHHIENATSQVVIDLDAEYLGDDAGPGIGHDQQLCEESTEQQKEKEGNDIQSAIVLDSDDEDGGSNVPEMQSPNYDKGSDFRAWLSSQIQLRMRENKLSTREAHPSQVFSEQGNNKLYPDIAPEGRKLPSIQYEKVVLTTVTDKQPVPDLQITPVLLGNFHIQGSVSELYCDQQRRTKSTPKSRVVGRERGGGKKPAVIGDNIVGEGRLDSGHNIEAEAADISPAFVDSEYYSPHSNQETSEKSDGLDDLWRDMSVAMECSKDATPTDGLAPVQNEEVEDCNHSFKFNDELGLVCLVCGVVQKSIETIFDYQWTKGTQSTRTYARESRNSNVDGVGKLSGAKISEHLLIGADISIHPRHMKQMKPHQIEGFNFLVKNLLADPPGGCILAHAPGSGKTFMLISFIQSFMAKDPNARPLVVLPKGILATWRKEFQRWQVEDIPLYDFYSSKADNRSQQLEILNNWHENRSILLLGYKQFSNIICEGAGNNVTAACQEKLLRVPTLLILDEGHNPRNDNTDMVGSLAKVRTPCKVVLSGTLFQNHVEEVFNILKLVRPNFMKSDPSRIAMKRIRSMAFVPSGRRSTKGNSESYFCELVEETLRSDDNYKRRISVIQELRDMTRDVLHYYKGDFLDELPGLVDYTVLLNLGMKQKESIRKLGKLEKFKKSSIEKAIYMHPQLVKLKENASGDKDTSIDIQKVDKIIGSIDVRDGVKAKFFMNLLCMAESSGEKVLVFSQYLLPLKFLERLIVQTKGWRLRKEFFVIYGDSSPEDREWSMEQFNNSPEAKVFFGSIKACGEGISLVGASRVLILDVHLNPSVTRQAIGRAFRPGQEKKLYVYRLVAAESQEEEDHGTSFRKELISKMWFEWSEYCGQRDFELEAVDVTGTEDRFLENNALREDIKILYRR